MTKIIKNQYLGECKVDSLKIRIPLKALINYDKSLNDTYIKVCEETGEPLLDSDGDIKRFKDSCKVYDLGCVPLRVGIAKQVRCGKNYEDYLFILINSKHAHKNYLRGVDMETMFLIYRSLIELEIIEIEWLTFIEVAIPTDIDFKIDYDGLLFDEYKEMLNGCHKMTKTSSDRDKGATKFKDKGNVGISWSVRQTSKYKTNPYTKIYHKGLEMQNKSYEFYMMYLSNYDLTNRFRIETTVKNKEHLKSLNKRLKLGFESYNLRELLTLSPEKKRSIIQYAINCHLYPRKKSLQIHKDKRRMTPADSIMYSSLLGFIQDCNWTYLQVEQLLLSRIENESSKSLNKKKLRGFYDDIVCSKNYDIKANKIESVFDSWGWF